MKVKLLPWIAIGLVLGGCGSKKAAVPVTPPAAPTRATRVAVETVTVRDADVDRRIARAELKVLERDAQLVDLQARLDEATQEVVRAMAKLQTIASRAEAASGMAEAEVALRTLRSGQPAAPEASRVTQLLEQSSAEFNNQNFGGALYLATAAKNLANAGRSRLPSDDRPPRTGETAFAIPIGLKLTGRGNVREGPGTTFRVVFAGESGQTLTGYSYVDEWIRVTDESGRSGWIFRNLVASR